MAGFIGAKASIVSNGAERKQTYAITKTTTSLTGLKYTPSKVHVYHNGIRLVDGTDYTATNGTSITLITAAEDGDEVVVISYATFQTSDTVSAANGGTFAGNVEHTGTLTASGDLNAGTIKDATGTNTAITIDSSGIVTTGGNNPQFFATLSAAQGSLADNTHNDILFNTVSQVGSGFNTTTGKFTCPVDGIYLFCANLYAYFTRQAELALFKNGTKIIRSVAPVVSADANPNGASLSTIISCNASDVIHLKAYGDTGGSNWTIYHAEGATHFSGYLIG